MLNKVISLKNKYNNLGKHTKFIIKISFIFVITCLLSSFSCFILKDFTEDYIFFYRVSEELLLAARSCFGIGLIFSIIGIKTETETK